MVIQIWVSVVYGPDQRARVTAEGAGMTSAWLATSRIAPDPPVAVARRVFTVVLVVSLVLVGVTPFDDVVAAVLAQTGTPVELLPGDTGRLSVDSTGNEANDSTESPSVSGDGRFVAFHSFASNLVSADTNGVTDVFVHDRVTGQTERVSVDSSGNQGNSFSERPSISADGRFVAFDSASTNLVAGDTNSRRDVFVHDRLTGQTERISVSSSGNQGDNSSGDASISADGQLVAFESESSNLVAFDTNGWNDVFVHDRATGETERVSVDSSGNQADSVSELSFPDGRSISGDGRFVAFWSFASNLVAGDTNGRTDVFVHDRVTGLTERVSVDSAGVQANGFGSTGASISADGQLVAFHSSASNLVVDDTNGRIDVFVHDRATGETERVSVDSMGNEASELSTWPSLSADGRFVAFRSFASDLVAGDTNGQNDIFVHDRETRVTGGVSMGPVGKPGNLNSGTPSVSGDGRFVAFDSRASNLVVGDDNSTDDVFVHHVGPTPTGFWVRPVGDRLGIPQPSAGSAEDPVETSIGNFTNSWADLEGPGLLPMVLERTYNSRETEHGLLGLGFTTLLDVQLEDAGGIVEVLMADGRRVRFDPSGPAPEQLRAELTGGGSEPHSLVFDDGWTWDFDTAGRLVEVTSWTGESLTIVRDSAGAPTTASTSTGYSLTFDHNPEPGVVLRATTSWGDVIDYLGASSHGLLDGVVWADGREETYSYSLNGLLAQIIDGDGVATVTNKYDIWGRVGRQQESSGSDVSFAYDATLLTTTVTDRDTGQSTIYVHDDEGHLTSVQDVLGAAATRAYDADGYLTSAQDRRGFSLTQVRDTNGNLLSSTHETSGGGTATWSATYDAENRPTSVSDELLGTTTMTYAGDSRIPATVTDQNNQTTTIVSADGLVTAVTDPDGVTTTYAYDAARNLTSVTDGAGNTTSYAYDAAGRRTSITDPQQVTRHFEYDQAGRVTFESLPSLPTTGTSYTYDARGLLTSITDPEGNVTSHTYDAAGQLIKTIDANLGETVRSYTAYGDVATETSPGGGVTSYTYDGLGRLTSVEDPTGATTSYGYDANGNQVSTTNHLGDEASRTVDAQGRVTATTDELARTTSSEYDEAGRLTATVTPEGIRTEHSYDSAGNLLETTVAGVVVEARTYTAAGRLATISDAEGGVTSHSYDAAGRLATVTGPEGGVTTRTYDARGFLDTVTSPEGHVTDYDHDANGWLVAQTLPASGRTEFGYDLLGRRTTVTDALGHVTSFDYDPLGNLATVTDENDNTTTYTYDPDRNRTSRTDALGNVEIWIYDLAGRTTAQVDALGRQTDYAYDPLGRLDTVTDPSGRRETRSYDAAGQLVGRSYDWEPADVLFIVGDATSPATTDQAANDLLEAAGAAVTLIDDEDVTEESGVGRDLIAMSSTVVPSNLATDFADANIPIVTWQFHQFHDYGLVASPGDAGAVWQASDLQLTDPDHPLAANRRGQQRVLDLGSEIAWGNPAGDVEAVGMLADGSGLPALLAAEQGALLADGEPAPARRDLQRPSAAQPVRQAAVRSSDPVAARAAQPARLGPDLRQGHPAGRRGRGQPCQRGSHDPGPSRRPGPQRRGDRRQQPHRHRRCGQRPAAGVDERRTQPVDRGPSRPVHSHRRLGRGTVRRPGPGGRRQLRAGQQPDRPRDHRPRGLPRNRRVQSSHGLQRTSRAGSRNAGGRGALHRPQRQHDLDPAASAPVWTAAAVGSRRG